MHEEPRKELVDDGVFPGMIEEEKVADQGVALPEEKAQEVMAKDEQDEEVKAEVENGEGGEQSEKVVSGTSVKEALKDALKDDKVEDVKDEEIITADVLEDAGDDSDDHTEKALSDNGSTQRRSLQIDTELHTTEENITQTALEDDEIATPVAEDITDSPQPQTPTTPDNARMSNASMTSVPLSETDMSYDHLSAEQVEDFLATPRNNGSRHIRRPSSLEILQNSWEPARQSTLFDANAPPTPNLDQLDRTLTRKVEFAIRRVGKAAQAAWPLQPADHSLPMMRGMKSTGSSWNVTNGKRNRTKIYQKVLKMIPLHSCLRDWNRRMPS
jgi:hypothetical protein